MLREACFHVGVLLVIILAFALVPGAQADEHAGYEPLEEREVSGEIRGAIAQHGVALVEREAPSETIVVPEAAVWATIQASWSSPSPAVDAVRIEACGEPCADGESDRRRSGPSGDSIRVGVPVEGEEILWRGHVEQGAAERVTIEGTITFWGEPSTTEPGSEHDAQASDAMGSTMGPWERVEPLAGALGVGALLATAFLYGNIPRKVLLGLYHRIDRDEVLEHPTRREVYETILEAPGIHFRELARCLDLGHEALNQHLRLLRKRGLVREEYIGNRRCCFERGWMDSETRRGIAFAKAESRRRILEALSEEEATVTALAGRLDLAVSTVSYHLERLSEGSLVEERQKDRGKRLGLTGIGQDIVDLLEE